MHKIKFIKINQNNPCGSTKYKGQSIVNQLFDFFIRIINIRGNKATKKLLNITEELQIKINKGSVKLCLH